MKKKRFQLIKYLDNYILFNNSLHNFFLIRPIIYRKSNRQIH